jgi:hypothetical protein
MTDKKLSVKTARTRGRPDIVRSHGRVSLAPLSVDEALEALLKTPPPPKDAPPPTRARKQKRKARR